MYETVNLKQLKETVIEFMQKLELYDERSLKEIPNSWERYGDLVIFHDRCFLSSNWLVPGDDLWELLCNLLKCRRIGLKGKITNDNYRSPKVKLVYGDPGEVQFNDNGIKYTWDLERSMFCRGNASERHRIANLDCSDLVIVDLFAGIGYFTLPYLVKAEARLVHSCEWNPHAVKALRNNLKLNNVSDRCIIYEGDNRKFCPKNVGNIINVGLIPDSEGFWKTACDALLCSGGVVYIHQNVTSGISEIGNNFCIECDTLFDQYWHINLNYCVTMMGTPPFLNLLREKRIYWKRSEWFKFSLHISHVLLSYLEEINKSKWEVTIKEYFKVKSYAPHIDHIVYGAYCYPLYIK